MELKPGAENAFDSRDFTEWKPGMPKDSKYPDSWYKDRSIKTDNTRLKVDVTKLFGSDKTSGYLPSKRVELRRKPFSYQRVFGHDGSQRKTKQRASHLKYSRNSDSK